MAKRKRAPENEPPQQNGRPEVDPEHLRRTDTADAFIRDPDDGGPIVADDDLAEVLGEEFVLSATTAEDMSDEALQQGVPEDIGGPFVESSPEVEFADGPDESNPADADAEPMPRAVSGLAVRPPEDEE